MELKVKGKILVKSKQVSIVEIRSLSTGGNSKRYEGVLGQSDVQIDFKFSDPSLLKVSQQIGEEIGRRYSNSKITWN